VTHVKSAVQCYVRIVEHTNPAGETTSWNEAVKSVMMDIDFYYSNSQNRRVCGK
jgi:hypothetical protein